MGIVLRAYDEALQRTVALKVLRPELAEGSSRQRLVREAQAVAQIRHDHVVTIYAVANPPDGLPYFVREHRPGPTLADLLGEDKALDPRQAVTWIAQAADGLAAVHATGVLHRDVNPANLILAPATDRVKVLDFGLTGLGERPSEMPR